MSEIQIQITTIDAPDPLMVLLFQLGMYGITATILGVSCWIINRVDRKYSRRPENV